MIRFTIMTAAAMLIFITPVYAESAPEINEGSCEITTTVEMPKAKMKMKSKMIGQRKGPCK